MPIVTTSSRPRPGGPSFRAAAFIALGAIIILAVAAYFLLRENSAPSEPQPAPSASLVPAAPSAAHSQMASSVEDGSSEGPSAPIPQTSAAPVMGEPLGAAQPEPVAKPKTPEELGLPIYDKGEKDRVRKSFDTATERIISGLANTKRGFVPPPKFQLPVQENIIEILQSDIVIYDDDDEKIQKAKENCAALKEEMKKYIADGGTAENFLSWYHNELAKDYNTWKESQMYIVELMKQGMVSEAEEYMAKANAALSKAGIREVSIPENLRKLGEKKLKELQENGL